MLGFTLGELKYYIVTERTKTRYHFRGLSNVSLFKKKNTELNKIK